MHCLEVGLLQKRSRNWHKVARAGKLWVSSMPHDHIEISRSVDLDSSFVGLGLSSDSESQEPQNAHLVPRKGPRLRGFAQASGRLRKGLNGVRKAPHAAGGQVRARLDGRLCQQPRGVFIAFDSKSPFCSPPEAISCSRRSTLRGRALEEHCAEAEMRGERKEMEKLARQDRRSTVFDEYA